MDDRQNDVDQNDPSAGGRDTATGTDPDAKYEQPGFEDKSLGQAVNQDMDLVEELIEESGGAVGHVASCGSNHYTGRV